MPEHHQRVVLDGIDWRETLPFLRIFRAFSMALWPHRLLLSLLLVLLLYLGGTAMDFAWQKAVNPHELQAYERYDAQRYAEWLQQVGTDGRTDYIFETLVKQQVAAFERLIVSATNLDFGLSDLAAGMGADSGGVIGALADMAVKIPGWLYATHPGFLIVYLLYAFALTTLIGTAISRLAALDACRSEHISAFVGLRFALSHWVQAMLVWLIPLGIVVIIKLVLALAGLIFFNLPVLNILGGVLYGLFLILGFFAAIFLIGLALGMHILIPAISVEATDAFEVLGRAFNYVLGRFWRYLFYTATMIVYGALTYLMIGLIVFSTIWMTRSCLSMGVLEAADGSTRLDAVMPDPAWGELLAESDWDQLNRTETITAAIVMVWNRLLIAILPAFAISYYFNAHVWIYLLLRRSADLVEFDEVYTEPDPDELPPPAHEKIEPEAE